MDKTAKIAMDKNSYGYGYGKYKPRNLVEQSGISLCSSSRGSKTHTSLHKKLNVHKKNSKCAVSSRFNKTLLRTGKF